MASMEPPQKKPKFLSESELLNKGNVNIKKVMDDINLCQSEIERLNEKASEEILQIEQKYNKMRKPFFRQRNEHFKKLPNFWGTAFSQHPNISTIIQEEEKDCLKYMNDCIAEEFDDIKLGYLISFHFDENPYLENSVITKTMHLASSANARSESTPIKWKEGKDLIKKYNTKISNHSRRRRDPPATFFSWFLDNSNASVDEVAETIKEDLWPSALQYYLSTDKNGEMEYNDDDISSGESAIEEEMEEYGEEEVPDSEDEFDTNYVKDVKIEKENPVLVGEVDSIAEAELEGGLDGGDEDSQDYPENSENEVSFDQDSNSEIAKENETQVSSNSEVANENEAHVSSNSDVAKENEVQVSSNSEVKKNSEHVPKTLDGKNKSEQSGECKGDVGKT